MANADSAAASVPRGSSSERDVLVARLLARARQGAKLGLDRVEEALVRLGRPHADLVVVHVAGTNGKGSTCAMVEAIAREAGLSTGFYSSPHLARLNERIRIDGAPAKDDLFQAALERALASDLPELSFFEVLTVASLWLMREVAVDIAILEVGLGGRLDATNVVGAPACTAITNIGLDHTSLLGDGLAAIAREKAGICKAGVPLVLGRLAPEATEAALEAARAAGSTPVWQVAAAAHLPRDARTRPERHVDSRALKNAQRFSTNPATSADSATIRIDECVSGIRLGLPNGIDVHATPLLAGRHQHANAAVAAAAATLAARRTGRIDASAIARGLERTRWPGRMERIEQGGVTVLFDCAHNLEAVEALCGSVELAADRTVLVFGAMEDKPWRAMLGMLAPRTRLRIYTEPIERLVARGPAPLADLRAVAPGEAIRDPEAALWRALELASPGDTVLVTGSIFLVGAARAALLGQPRDVAVPL